jgi:hypothetical protein
MPDSYFLKPGRLGPDKLPFCNHAYAWVSSPGTHHQSSGSLHKPQPIAKHSAPTIPHNGYPSTATPREPAIATSTSVESLLVSNFETKLHVPSAPCSIKPPSATTKDREFSTAF